MKLRRLGALGRPGALVAASAGLLLLAQPPLPLGAVVFVALVPVLRVLDRKETPREGARTGALLFGVFWAVHLGWVPLLSLRLGVVWPVPAYFSQVSLLALAGAGFGAGVVLLRSRGLPLAWAAAVAWVAVEWCRGTLLGPLRFPWSGLALPLADIPFLVQPAAWVGESGLAFGVAAVNGLLAGLPAPARSGRSRWFGGAGSRPAVLALGVLAGWSGLGWARIHRIQNDVRPAVRVLAVQPGTPLEVKRDPESAPAAAWAALEEGVSDARDADVDLVVFPETHLPLLVGPSASDAALRRAARSRSLPAASEEDLARLAALSAGAGMDLLVGGWYAAESGVQNAVLRVTAGGVTEAYGKRGLVPGVEWAPGEDLVHGKGPAVLGTEGRPAPLVCIESAWAGLSRAGARAGAGWLLNVTNDAWLMGDAWWTRTPAFHQHPRHLVFRSVETGLGALRVGTTGWTGAVDPLGRWSPAVEPGTRGAATITVRRLPGPTLHVRIGNFAGPGCLLVLLVGGVGALWRDPRSRATPG